MSVKKIGKYMMGRTLGEGAFGKVKLGVHCETQVRVAIKILRKDLLTSSNMIDQIKREIAIMKKINHKHIVNLHEVLSSPTKLYMVLELVTGGELFWRIVSEGKFNENIARIYFQQLIKGVAYVHSQGIVHRDLKPENLLLAADGTLKITDFGLSTFYIEGDSEVLMVNACGTHHYAAPEVTRGAAYDGKAADVWSCGVILYVFLSGELPFESDVPEELHRKIQAGIVNYPRYFPKDAVDLLRRLLTVDPKQRIDIPGIIAHPWFQQDYELDDTPNIDIDGMRMSKLFNSVDEATQAQKHELKFTNAFELIGMSGTLDLGKMLRKSSTSISTLKNFTRFSSKHTAEEIAARLEEVLRPLLQDGMHYKYDNSRYRMKISSTRKRLLAFTIEISCITSAVRIVDFRRMRGSIVDFYECYKQICSELTDLMNVHSPRELARSESGIVTRKSPTERPFALSDGDRTLQKANTFSSLPSPFSLATAPSPVAVPAPATGPSDATAPHGGKKLLFVGGAAGGAPSSFLDYANAAAVPTAPSAATSTSATSTTTTTTSASSTTTSTTAASTVPDFATYTSLHNHPFGSRTHQHHR